MGVKRKHASSVIFLNRQILPEIFSCDSTFLEEFGSPGKMKGGEFDGSLKIYMEPENGHAFTDVELGQDGYPYGLEIFSKEVENVKEDINDVEKLYSRVQLFNQEIKIAQNANAIKELRAQLNVDLVHLLNLAKQIDKKFDGLVRANAAQRRQAGSDDLTRASMISDLAQQLKHIMCKFQGLRAQMETDHRQLIESRYFAITQEKATAEAIDNLLTHDVAESPLHDAMLEHGRGPVMEAVAEIQERRYTMMESRRSLMSLHQILLGIATPVTAVMTAEGQGESRSGGGGEGYPNPAVVGSGLGSVAKAGTGGLNDYEKETRKQAIIAIAVALVMIIIISVVILRTEYAIENGP